MSRIPHTLYYKPKHNPNPGRETYSENRKCGPSGRNHKDNNTPHIIWKRLMRRNLEQVFGKKIFNCICHDY